MPVDTLAEWNNRGPEPDEHLTRWRETYDIPEKTIDDKAREWAWDYLIEKILKLKTRKLNTEYGFFLHGWNAKKQFDAKQRAK